MYAMVLTPAKSRQRRVSFIFSMSVERARTGGIFFRPRANAVVVTGILGSPTTYRRMAEPDPEDTFPTPTELADGLGEESHRAAVWSATCAPVAGLDPASGLVPPCRTLWKERDFGDGDHRIFSLRCKWNRAARCKRPWQSR